MIGFNRIRCVTGYLPGDVKMMNNSKQVEVSELRSFFAKSSLQYTFKSTH